MINESVKLVVGNADEYKQVQEIVFALGGSWKNFTKNFYEWPDKHQVLEYMFIEFSDGLDPKYRILLGHGGDAYYFHRTCKYKEVTFKQLKDCMTNKYTHYNRYRLSRHIVIQISINQRVEGVRIRFDDVDVYSAQFCDDDEVGHGLDEFIISAQTAQSIKKLLDMVPIFSAQEFEDLLAQNNIKFLNMTNHLYWNF